MRLVTLRQLLSLRARILTAVAEIDLRGTDERITESMRAIEVTFDNFLCSESTSGTFRPRSLDINLAEKGKEVPRRGAYGKGCS